MSNKKFIVPSKPKNRQEERLTVILIGSAPVSGLKSRPAIGTINIDSHYPVIDCQTNSILSVFPNADIISVGGHDINRLIRFRPKGVRIIENTQYKTTGDIEDVRLSLNCTVTDSVLIVSNNILFNSDTLKQLKLNSSCILVGGKNSKKDRIGLTYYNYKAENIAFGIGSVIHNFVYLKGPELVMMQRFCMSKNKKYCYLFEALNEIIQNGGNLRVIQNHCYLKTITSLEELT